jgi:hypothetical protein
VGLRKGIARWLVDAGIDDETKDAVVLAAHEATASAIGSSSASVSKPKEGLREHSSSWSSQAIYAEWASPERTRWQVIDAAASLRDDKRPVRARVGSSRERAT